MIWWVFTFFEILKETSTTEQEFSEAVNRSCHEILLQAFSSS